MTDEPTDEVTASFWPALVSPATSKPVPAADAVAGRRISFSKSQRVTSEETKALISKLKKQYWLERRAAKADPS